MLQTPAGQHPKRRKRASSRFRYVTSAMAKFHPRDSGPFLWPLHDKDIASAIAMCECGPSLDSGGHELQMLQLNS